MNSATSRPAPRKDLSKVSPLPKRKRSSKSTSAMSIEQLVAALSDDTTMMEPPPPPEVHYYAYETVPPARKTGWEPRLLIRQAYKVATEASVVIGLESVQDYKPSIYVLNNESTVSLTLEDLISLQSVSVVASVDRYFNEANAFKPLYLNTIAIEPSGGGDAIAITNYHIKGNMSLWNRQVPRAEMDIVKPPDASVLLRHHGWESLKKHFNCVETYYRISTECSLTVQHLMSRYTHYLTNHYKSEAVLSGNIAAAQQQHGKRRMTPITLDAELIRRITADLPLFLQDLNERRLPPEQQQHQQQAFLPPLVNWLDAEVRRFCSPNLIESVLENLKYLW